MATATQIPFIKPIGIAIGKRCGILLIEGIHSLQHRGTSEDAGAQQHSTSVSPNDLVLIAR